MRSRLLIIRIVKVLLGLSLFIILLHSTLRFLDITFTSEKAQRVLVEQIKILTQRETRIDGPVEITVSLLPEIVVKGLHINNIEGFALQYD